MRSYKDLQPFGDAVQGLRELAGRYEAGRALKRGAVVPGRAAGQQRPGRVRRNNLRGPGWRVQAFTRAYTARPYSAWDASPPRS